MHMRSILLFHQGTWTTEYAYDKHSLGELLRDYIDFSHAAQHFFPQLLFSLKAYIYMYICILYKERHILIMPLP